ncbi:MAG: SpoIID/LytB domain-containing protein [Candidatus Omnitrophica bacterium]|nr:SpoIID/LytB domain-containing protein [Candidatus Omnitrophota bacterium]
MRFKLAIFLPILSILLIPVNISAATIHIPDKIRVVVSDETDELNLSIRGKYRITTIETGEVLKRGKTFFNIKITPAANGIVFGKDLFKIYAIEITPEREPSIYLGKRLYRGSLQIVRTKKESLRAINVVNLKDYLKGVLYHEVSHRWPMEAIKAQAIVSRTFALYKAQQNKNNYYYLTSDISSQVYGGVYAGRYRTNKAVEATEDEVLLYRGEILPAFFHATCGGTTEDVSRLWKLSLKPLKGITCPYCKNSPHFYWKKDVEFAYIEERLKDAGYDVRSITSIKIGKRDPSSRIIRLEIRSASGVTLITAKDFRQILGSRLIRSTNFKVNVREEKAFFEGKGWGHGVGMCQWGAFTMAKKRKKAEDILRLYYPGASITKLK